MTSTIDRRGLVTTIDGATHLVGARCTVCTTHTFPPQPTCPRCGAGTEEVPLPSHGTVWSWTVQRTRPKPPYVGAEHYEPFAVAYVDLDLVKVETRLDGKPVDGWSIDDPVRLVAGEADADGDVWSFRFVPDEETS